jgi:hypothetical protein
LGCCFTLKLPSSTQSPAPLLLTLLRHYSGAAQEMIREITKHGLDDLAVLCSSNGNFSRGPSFGTWVVQNWDTLPSTPQLSFRSSSLSPQSHIKTQATSPIRSPFPYFLFKANPALVSSSRASRPLFAFTRAGDPRDKTDKFVDTRFHVARTMRDQGGARTKERGHLGHAKNICMDRNPMYIGSENTYPSYNEEKWGVDSG